MVPQRKYLEYRGVEALLIEFSQTEWIAFFYKPPKSNFELHRIANLPNQGEAEQAAQNWIDEHLKN